MFPSILVRTTSRIFAEPDAAELAQVLIQYARRPWRGMGRLRGSASPALALDAASAQSGACHGVVQLVNFVMQPAAIVVLFLNMTIRAF